MIIFEFFLYNFLGTAIIILFQFGLKKYNQNVDFYDDKEYSNLENKDKMINSLLHHSCFIIFYIFGFNISLIETLIKPNKIIRIMIIIVLYGLWFFTYFIITIVFNK